MILGMYWGILSISYTVGVHSVKVLGTLTILLLYTTVINSCLYI